MSILQSLDLQAQPDLIIVSPNVSPTTVSGGITITVSCTITNQGSSKADFPLLQSNGLYYYLSSNTSYDASDTQLGTSNINDINAGASQSVTGKTLTIPSGLTAGTYYILFFIDKEANIVESNESNNVGNKSITYYVPKPDLVVQSPSGTPLTINSGSAISVSCTIKNQGDATADFPLTQLNGLYYYLSANTTYETSDVQLGTSNISDISAGGTQAVSGKSLTIPTTTTTGIYYILYYIDKENNISESSETNNIGMLQITVNMPMPDLIVQFPSASPTSVISGNAITVGSTVKNQGTGTADFPITQLNGLYYYLSTDNAYSSGDIQLGTSNISDIVPGGTQGVSGKSLTIPATTTSGTYYILYYIDKEGNITESSETNNVSNVQISVTKPYPDLIVQSPGGSPTTINSGSDIAVSCVIKNQGTATADFPTTQLNGLYYYLSTDNSYSSGDLQLGTSNINDITASSTQSISGKSLTIPETTTSGAYYIVYYVDKENNITESSESNNTASLLINVHKQMPDLVILTPSVSPLTVNSGSNLTVSCTVKNQGDAIADYPILQLNGLYYYLSTNTTYEATDIQIGTSNINDIAAGGTNSIAGKNLTIPSGTASGIYYILYYADKDNDIVESSEINNIAYVSVTVHLQIPDLIVQSPTATPATILSGNSLNVGCIIRNIGDAVADFPITQLNGLYYYLSSNTTYEVGDIQLGTSNINDLNPDLTQTISNKSLTIPQNTIGGTYYILLYIDKENNINEFSETNNIGYVQVNVSIPKPDLTITNVSLDKAAVQLGESLNLSYTIKNAGPGASAGVSTTGIYVSATQYGADRLFIENSEAVFTSVNESRTISSSFVLPQDITPGNYFIVAFSDHKNQVDEGTNENNNTNGKAVVIFKFQVTAINISVTPPSLFDGEMITKSAVLNGNGNGTVSYLWEESLPGSSTWTQSTLESVIMSNGSANIQAKQVVANKPNGVHSYRLAIINPNSITSNPVNVSVNLKDVIYPEIHPLRISQNGDQKFQLIARITDMGNGVNPATVKLSYMKVPTTLLETDKGSVIMSRIGGNSDYYEGVATDPSLYTGKFDEGQSVVWKIEAADLAGNLIHYPQDLPLDLKNQIIEGDIPLATDGWAQRFIVHNLTNLNQEKTFNFTSIPTGLLSFKQNNDEIKLYNNSAIWYEYAISPQSIVIDGNPTLKGFLEPREGVIPMTLGALMDRSTLIKNVLSTDQINISLDRKTVKAQVRNVVDMLANCLKGVAPWIPVNEWGELYDVLMDAIDIGEIISAAGNDMNKATFLAIQKLGEEEAKTRLTNWMMGKAFNHGLTSETATLIGKSAGNTIVGLYGFASAVNNQVAFIWDVFKFPNDQEYITLARSQAWQLDPSSIPGSTSSTSTARLYAGEHANFNISVILPGAFRQPYLALYGEAKIYSPDGALVEITQIPEIGYQTNGRLGFSFGDLGQEVTIKGLSPLPCNIAGYLDISSTGHTYVSEYKPYFIEITIFQGAIPGQNVPFPIENLLSSGRIPFRLFDRAAPLKPVVYGPVQGSTQEVHNLLIENSAKDVDYYRVFIKKSGESTFGSTPVIFQNTGGAQILATMSFDSPVSSAEYKIQAVDISGNESVLSDPVVINLSKVLLSSPLGNIDFGDIDVYTTRVKTITLLNSGASTLSITDISLTGIDAADFEIISPSVKVFDLTSKQTVDIKIRFAPTTEGLKDAELNISNNSENSAPIKKFTIVGNAQLLTNMLGSSEEEIKIFPNPVHDQLNIMYNTQKPFKVMVLDINGSKILERVVNSNVIDVSQLRPGVYFLILESKRFKFIKN